MYCVIQLDEKGGNGLATVHESWLTPLKKDVFWPPYKDSRSFRRALVEGERIDEEKWWLYGVTRIFYKTSELDKALQKEKEAETISDLNSDIEIAEKSRSERPVRTKIKRRIVSDSSEEESSYTRPPSVKINRFLGSRILNSREDSTSPAIEEVAKLSTNRNSQGPSSVSSYNNICQEQGIKLLITAVNQIKEQNKLVFARIDQIEKYLKKNERPCTTEKDVKENFPVKLPLTTKDQLEVLEEFLSKEENLQILVSYLGSLGGKNLKSKIHNILRALVKDELASIFSYYGKRKKEAFHELNLNKAVIRAVQLATSVSLTDIEETTKLWIKHAPDRVKSRRKTPQVENSLEI